MKITEMLNMCDTLFPNEFTEKEKLMWCDELGAIISREHAKHRLVENVEITGGRYALPVGVKMSEIDRVVAGDVLIKKSDALSMGIKFIEDGDRVYVVGDNVNKNVKFLLRPRYEKIRRISVSGAVFLVEEDLVTMPWRPLQKGDLLQIEAGDNTYHVTAGEPKINSDNTISFKTTGDILPQGKLCGDIKRIITDETVCSAPFDAMYCDFIGAKICFYQRDYDSYNHHMALFNSRLEDYDRNMKQNTPLLKDCRVSNWWH